jgi:hypothetical protein
MCHLYQTTQTEPEDNYAWQLDVLTGVVKTIRRILPLLKSPIIDVHL